MTDWKYYKKLQFKDKGRDHTGVDCWGLVQMIYKKELGIALPGYDECYDETSEREKLAAIIGDEKQKWREILPPERPKLYDVVLLRMHGFASHVGVICGGRNMIHCTEGVGITIEPYDSLRWAKKVLGFYRYE